MIADKTPQTAPEASDPSRAHRSRLVLALVALCLAASAGALYLLLRPRLVFLSQQATSSRNLRDIGQAISLYCASNGGVQPQNLQALVDAGLIDPKQLIDPASGHFPPAADYSYVLFEASGPERCDPRWMCAWSDPRSSRGKGANVVFLDGHCEWVIEPHFSAMLAEFRREYEKTFGKPPTIIAPQPPVP